MSKGKHSAYSNLSLSFVVKWVILHVIGWLEEAENSWVDFAKKIGAKSLSDLRAIPAKMLLDATDGMGAREFPGVIDGYFFPKSPLAILSAGEGAHVPLMVGWNSEEMNYRAFLGDQDPTPENYAMVVRGLYKKGASFYR